MGVLFDCFKGEPPGLAPRSVDDERPKDESGRLKGEARPLELNRGAGFMGDVGFDFAC